MVEYMTLTASIRPYARCQGSITPESISNTIGHRRPSKVDTAGPVEAVQALQIATTGDHAKWILVTQVRQFKYHKYR